MRKEEKAAVAIAGASVSMVLGAVAFRNIRDAITTSSWYPGSNAEILVRNISNRISGDSASPTEDSNLLASQLAAANATRENLESAATAAVQNNEALEEGFDSLATQVVVQQAEIISLNSTVNAPTIAVSETNVPPTYTPESAASTPSVVPTIEQNSSELGPYMYGQDYDRHALGGSAGDNNGYSSTIDKALIETLETTTNLTAKQRKAMYLDLQIAYLNEVDILDGNVPEDAEAVRNILNSTLVLDGDRTELSPIQLGMGWRYTDDAGNEITPQFLLDQLALIYRENPGDADPSLSVVTTSDGAEVTVYDNGSNLFAFAPQNDAYYLRGPAEAIEGIVGYLADPATMTEDDVVRTAQNVFRWFESRIATESRQSLNTTDWRDRIQEETCLLTRDPDSLIDEPFMEEDLRLRRVDVITDAEYSDLVWTTEVNYNESNGEILGGVYFTVNTKILKDLVDSGVSFEAALKESMRFLKTTINIRNQESSGVPREHEQWTGSFNFGSEVRRFGPEIEIDWTCGEEAVIAATAEATVNIPPTIPAIEVTNPSPGATEPAETLETPTPPTPPVEPTTPVPATTEVTPTTPAPATTEPAPTDTEEAPPATTVIPTATVINVTATAGATSTAQTTEPTTTAEVGTPFPTPTDPATETNTPAPIATATRFSTPPPLPSATHTPVGRSGNQGEFDGVTGQTRDEKPARENELGFRPANSTVEFDSSGPNLADLNILISVLPAVVLASRVFGSAKNGVRRLVKRGKRV